MIRLGARARSVDEGRTCVDLGFELLEITLPCPGGPGEEAAWIDLGRQNHLFYLAHGPEEGNPSDLAHLENDYLPRLEAALAAAHRLKCLGLTLHFWLDSRWLKNDCIADKIALLARIVDRGRALAVPVNLENLSEDWQDLAPALKAVPDLGLTLDLGHAQLMRPESTAPDILEHFFPRVRHLHLHDNRGGRGPRDDLHLIPGQGIVPFARIFAVLKKMDYNRTATLELRPHEMKEGREWIKTAWREA